MIILGINDGRHHNTSAALFRDGTLIASAEEERFSRIKMDNAYPTQAINEVLNLADISLDDVDVIALANLPRSEQTPYANVFFKQVFRLSKTDKDIRSYFWKHQFDRFTRRFRGRKTAQNKILATKPTYTVEHHLAHAASAYYLSPFEDKKVGVITLDGAGDFSWGSVWVGENGELTKIAHFPHIYSIGLIYSAITIYLGFKATRHEGKILGLAAYGNPEPLLTRLLEHVDTNNWNELFSPKLAKVALGFNSPSGQSTIAELCSGLSKEDTAAGIQAFTEQLICNWIQQQAKELNVDYLALAGGVFANVKLNQRILELPEIKSIYVHPNMGDGGLATGAACEIYSQLNNGFAPVFKQQVYLGTEINKEQALSALQQAGISYTEPDNLAKEAAKLLANGKVVARADGKMEYGPRSLGNRSVMASCNDPKINEWLNKKFSRTEFMPFAPVIMQSHAKAYFPEWDESHIASRFMTITYNASELAKEKIPAAIHVDNTARPQVLRREDNPGYYNILFEFEKITGTPSTINTSFNMHEEPIVRTAGEAIIAFQQANLDALILGPYLIIKQ